MVLVVVIAVRLVVDAVMVIVHIGVGDRGITSAAIAPTAVATAVIVNSIRGWRGGGG